MTSLAFVCGVIVGWISMLLLLAVFIPRRAPEGLSPDAPGPVTATLQRKEVHP